MTATRKFTLKLFFGWLAGLFLAVLAFSQAAAPVGLAIDTFRPMGAGFFSWRSGQIRLAMSVFDPTKKVSGPQLTRSGQATLLLAPLTPRSLWLVGKGQEIQGELPKARKAMQQAERISRHDGAVQLWLGTDNISRGAITKGLRNFDLMIRADLEASAVVMPRLAMIIAAPEGRRYLAPFINEGNPWLLDLLHVAARDLPRAAPLAQLLVDRKQSAPDIPYVRAVYATLTQRLIQERSYSLALRLYPLLPGANSASLHNVSGVSDGKLEEGYPPFIWHFPDSDAQGASFVGVDRGQTGIESFGAPGTVGVAASKLVAPRGQTHFRWRVEERVANVQSSATWEVTCLTGAAAGTVLKSANLLDKAIPTGRSIAMQIPGNCELLRIDMRIAGGIGRSPASVVMSSFELAGKTAGR